MNIKAAFIALLVAAPVALSQPDAPPAAPGNGAEQATRFDNHKLVRVTLRSAEDLAAMSAISPDPWNCTVGIGVTDWRIPPERWADFLALNLPFQTISNNIQVLLDAESARIRAGRGLEGGGGLAFFNDFKNPQQISDQIDALVTAHPTRATRITIGQSIEGRDIYAIRIATPGSPDDKPAIFLNGVQHAREWISAMSAVYIADRLLNDGSDPRVISALDRFAFVIVPVVNPDGYQYTWSTNRLWRKNRRLNANNSRGVDLNRNWGFGWGVNIAGFSPGSSSSPNSDVYRGPSAFSEPETQVLRDWITARPYIRGSVDIHSYSQLILSPFGYTNVPAADHLLFDDLNTIFQSGVASAHGIVYTAGPTFTTIYPAAGTFGDWTYGSRGICGWSMEQRDRGQYGFVLPPDQIIPSASEAMAGILDWANAIGEPLRYTFPDGIPALVASNQPTSVRLVVSPLLRSVLAGSPVILASVGRNPDPTPIPLTLVSGTEYTATLPAAPCGSGIVFSFAATATGGGAADAVVTSPTLGSYVAFTATPRVVNGQQTLVACHRCPADFNLDGAVNSDDLSDYVTYYFNADSAADFNADGVLNSDDLSDFITAFFSPCP